MEESRRRHLPLVCSLKFFPFSFLSLISTVLSCFLIDQITRNQLFCGNCTARTHLALLALAYSHIFELLAIVVVALFLFCQRPCLFRWTLRAISKKKGDGWRCLCRWVFACSRCCSCCLIGGSEVLGTSKGASFLSEISVITGEYFDSGGNTVDVTPTDLLAGMAALAGEERLKRERKQQNTSVNKQSRVGFGVGVEAPLEPKCAVRTSTLAIGDFENFDEEIATSESLDSDFDDLIVSPHGTRRRRQVMVKTIGMRRDAWNSKGYFAVAERERLLPENPRDREVILDGAHYMKLAHAVYGFVMCATGSSYATSCSILAGLASCKSRAINKLAFLQLSGVSSSDLLYLSSSVGIEACPYGIVIDRSKKSIVVVIRGTLSLEDAVADLNLIPQPLQNHADRCPELKDEPGHCHAGILQSVLWIYQDLQRHRYLDSCFRPEASNELRDYQLVCTGHSLGAGCAAILSIALRKRYSKFVRCLCFSPPGCVLSPDIASQPFMTTYILDSDVVPRLSVFALESLRHDVLEAIARIKVPKHRVESGKDANQILHPPGSIPDSPFYQQLQSFLSHRESSREARITERAKLCLPGQYFVHLVKSSAPALAASSNSTRKAKKCYVPVWANRRDFSEISLRKSLMINHLSWRVQNQLDAVAATF